MDSPAIHPSQTVQCYLEIHARTIEKKLATIRAALSDDELKAILLDLARKSFQVWRATPRCNEESSSSNPEGSDPISSGSWEHVSHQTLTGQQSSPNPPLPPALHDVERSIGRKLSGPPGNTYISHATTVPNSQSAPSSTSYPLTNHFTNPHHAVDIPAAFNSMDSHHSTDLHTFDQSSFPATNNPGMENTTWLEQMQRNHIQQIQLSNSDPNFDNIYMGADMVDIDYRTPPPPNLPETNTSQWGDQYSHPGFTRFHGGL